MVSVGGGVLGVLNKPDIPGKYGKPRSEVVVVGILCSKVSIVVIWGSLVGFSNVSLPRLGNFSSNFQVVDGNYVGCD